MRRHPAILLLALAASALPGCGYMHHYHAHHFYPHDGAWWWYGDPTYRPLSPAVEARTATVPVWGDCTEPRCHVVQERR